MTSPVASVPSGYLGGGVERFVSPMLSLKGEVRYHRVSRTAAGRDPSGVSVTAGVKRYF